MGSRAAAPAAATTFCAARARLTAKVRLPSWVIYLSTTLAARHSIANRNAFNSTRPHINSPTVSGMPDYLLLWTAYNQHRQEYRDFYASHMERVRHLYIWAWSKRPTHD